MLIHLPMKDLSSLSGTTLTFKKSLAMVLISTNFSVGMDTATPVWLTSMVIPIHFKETPTAACDRLKEIPSAPNQWARTESVLHFLWITLHQQARGHLHRSPAYHLAIWIHQDDHFNSNDCKRPCCNAMTAAKSRRSTATLSRPQKTPCTFLPALLWSTASPMVQWHKPKRINNICNHLHDDLSWFLMWTSTPGYHELHPLFVEVQTYIFFRLPS